MSPLNNLDRAQAEAESGNSEHPPISGPERDSTRRAVVDAKC